MNAVVENINPVVRRIQKILSLAANAGTEAEAASAAEHAARLMREHNLSEAEVRLVEADKRPSEPIVTDHHVDTGSKTRVSWKCLIASGAARAFDCMPWFSGPTLRLFGRESAVQAASYTAQYLWREVDNLAEDQCRVALRNGMNPALTRRWKNSFRFGAASTIVNRLRHAKENAQRGVTSSVVGEAFGTPAPGPSSGAMILVEREAEEVRQEYSAFAREGGFKKRGTFRSGSSSSGYVAGREAGKTVSLGGGRRQLGRGQGRIGQ